MNTTESQPHVKLKATPGEPAVKGTERILEHWNKEEVESMYDKHLLNAEIGLVKTWIPRGVKVLDAGCGEGEGTLEYSREAAIVHGADYSVTRLEKAARRLANAPHVQFRQVDFLKEYTLDSDYDVVVTQRFLINLMEWERQRRVITSLVNSLKPGGRLLMLEGSQQGVDELNRFRDVCGLPPIPVRWHNRFLDDDEMENFIQENGWKLKHVDGLGTYFLMTRGVRPMLESKLDWDCEFNRIAASTALAKLGAFDPVRFSRHKLWVVER